MPRFLQKGVLASLPLGSSVTPSLQTHRALIDLLQNPLYRYVNDQMTQADFWEAMLEAVDEANIEQGVVR